MAAFLPPQNPPQPSRRTFGPGAQSSGLTFGPTKLDYNPRIRDPRMMNVPYAAKYSASSNSCHPFGYMPVKISSQHQEIPKPASERNSTFHRHREFGHWGTG